MTAPAATRKWKRLLAVGCSHGYMLDANAAAAVCKFIKSFKPHIVIHLGDFCDTTAFRAGAKGQPDEGMPIEPDVDGGLNFLKAIKPSIVFCGNHEDRLWRLRNSPNAIVSMCAEEVIRRIETTCSLMRATLVPYHIRTGWRKIGNYRFGHGYMYNVSAARDHAEAVGNVVFAHTHRTMLDKGRRIDNPTGICVGTLSDIPNMDYAKARRQTLGWSQGFVWGEYTDDECQLWLHEHPQGKSQWRLPA